MEQKRRESIAATLLGLEEFLFLSRRSLNLSSPSCASNLKTKEKLTQLSTVLFQLVSTVLNHCAFDGLIDTPPKFRRRKESEGRVLWYTKDEVAKLIGLSTDVFMREDLADIIQFAAYTGMRQGEILKIRAKDIDFESNRIHVGGAPTQTTKAKNWRAIPIHDCVWEILHLRCSQVTRKDVQLFGDEWRDKDQLLRAFKRSTNCYPRRNPMSFTHYDTVTQHGSLKLASQSDRSWLCAGTSVSKQHYDMQRLQMQHSRTQWLLSERD